MFDTILGTILGILTGLIPSIHSNNVAAVIPRVIVDPTLAASLVMATGIAHTIVNGIPAVFIGVPDASMALLPQHRLLHRGRGYYAVKLSLIGSVLAVPGSLLCVPLLFVLREVIGLVEGVVPYVVGVCFLLTVLWSAKWRVNLICAVFAALLGYGLFESGTPEPLMIMFSGMFGLSSIVVAGSVLAPVQIREFRTSLDSSYWWALMVSVSISAIALVLPTLGAAQAAIVASLLLRDMVVEKFIFVLGVLNTANQVLSVVWYMIEGSTRTGTAVALAGLGASMSLWSVFAVAVCSSLLACLVGLLLNRFIARRLRVLPVTGVNVLVAVMIVAMAVGLSGVRGVLWLVPCTCVGVVAFWLGARRASLMACIVVPFVLRAI